MKTETFLEIYANVHAVFGRADAPFSPDDIVKQKPAVGILFDYGKNEAQEFCQKFCEKIEEASGRSLFRLGDTARRHYDDNAPKSNALQKVRDNADKAVQESQHLARIAAAENKKATTTEINNIRYNRQDGLPQPAHFHMPSNATPPPTAAALAETQEESATQYTKPPEPKKAPVPPPVQIQLANMPTPELMVRARELHQENPDSAEYKIALSLLQRRDDIADNPYYVRPRVEHPDRPGERYTDITNYCVKYGYAKFRFVFLADSIFAYFSHSPNRNINDFVSTLVSRIFLSNPPKAWSPQLGAPPNVRYAVSAEIAQLPQGEKAVFVRLIQTHA